MALGSGTIWGQFKGYLYELFPQRVRMKRIAIGGSTYGAFSTYTTGGVAYDVCGTFGFDETNTSVILDPDVTYTWIYDKANNKIFGIVNATGIEIANGVNISATTIYGVLIGK